MTNAAGIDVSAYQTTTPSLAGLSFVFARAGYGSGNPADPVYATHAANVRKAGLVLGAYWFWYAGQDNAAAVAQFLSIAGSADLLVVDYEGANAGTSISDAEVRDFISRVHAAGRKCGLYHSLSGYPALGQDFDWVAAWGTSVAPSIHWDFWQYAGGPLDKDYFNGDAAALRAFVGGPMVNFTLLGTPVGTMSVKSDSPHAYLLLADGTLHPAGVGPVAGPAIPAKLASPIPGGSGDRQTGYLFGLSPNPAAFLLATDVTFVPNPTPTVLAPGNYPVK